MATTFRNDVTSYDAAYADPWAGPRPDVAHVGADVRADAHRPAAPRDPAGVQPPIRRASWAVDGTGCRPEAAARLVGDSLGLPVKGSDARPARGPVRFAQVNRPRDAAPRVRAHAVREGVRRHRTDDRAPRRPVRADAAVHHPDRPRRPGPAPRDRAVRAAGQQGTRDRAGVPAWHAHEREGGAWQGRSLLRDAYGAWLIKREMWRVNASSLPPQRHGRPQS